MNKIYVWLDENLCIEFFTGCAEYETFSMPTRNDEVFCYIEFLA